jgi:hypothetical protein
MRFNLDAMDSTDLMPFWSKYQSGRNYKDIFPFGGKGTKRATADLANYASNKYAAMFARKRGDITTAQMYEKICESIYGDLPDFARW